ncbi:fatty acid hydroxylase domain-containing protein 2 isoform X4 [Rattus norvegicus]|uniref:fatty acid hydroxylase domain-containing protein 2 isoform X4 n=2 Tax=Rattus norvegicus TaxID=10116 RepID=UPI001916E44A|nr:fatty acid hydroxylase domain-containing protein 2 isoform X4 [Rattus norvegicus]
MSFQKKGILFPAHTDLNFFSSRARPEPVRSPVMRSPGPASRPTQAEPGDNKVSLQSYSDTATTKPRTTAGCTCGLLTGTLGNNPSAEKGHIWDSMRRTALILGLGLLLLAAFWNSITWYPQRFWGASGDFWQTRWETLLSTFEGNEWILYIIGVVLVPGLCFWGFNGLLLMVDRTGKPTFISRYRIQLDKNEPVSNMLPVMVGPLAMGSHLSSITVWLSLVLIVSSITHCGYHLPFLPSPEFHDYHHLKFNQCYGVLGVMDHLHGTDVMFKQTKAYERHVILLGFTPLSESIPDPPKKTGSALGPSGPLPHQ